MGKTIVFVSHDLNSIAKYCDRVFLLNKGNLLKEGGPKEIIDAYKQVLVGQYKDSDAQKELQTGIDEAFGETGGVNPKALEYGDGRARILEYYVTDEQGRRTGALIKGTRFTVYMRVEFTATLPAPIFAFSIKNVQGTEITGTNTMLEKAFLESVRAGQQKVVSFTQSMDLQGGEYLISLGVTGYEGDTFRVYHRLYDVLNVTVVSDKDSVGFYDMNSRVVVKDAAETSATETSATESDAAETAGAETHTAETDGVLDYTKYRNKAR